MVGRCVFAGVVIVTEVISAVVGTAVGSPVLTGVVNVTAVPGAVVGTVAGIVPFVSQPDTIAITNMAIPETIILREA